MRISLFAKGLILLSVPLALQLIFVFWFFSVFDSASEGLKYQSAKVNASYKASQVMLLTGVLASDTVVSAAEFHTTRNAMSYSNVVATEAELRAALDELKLAGHPYPDIVQHAQDVVDKTEELLNVAFGDLGEERFATENLKFETSNYYFSRAVPYKKELLNKISWFNQPIASKRNQFADQGKLHLTIICAVAISVFLNVAALLSLWIIIRRNVVSKVKHFEENFSRLGANQELLPPIEGSDEFADFDHEFRQIVLGVVAARTERQHNLDIMSSSMREPLAALTAFLDRIDNGEFIKVNERAHKALLISKSATRRLILMLNELIDFEQIDQGMLVLSRDRASTKQIIEEALDCVKIRADQSKIHLVANLTNDIALEADSDRLIQVLINLLTNAIKFSPPGSTVDVDACRTNEGVIFSVSDQGRGIPTDMLDKVFMRFEQVDRAQDSMGQKGSGLGLTICKSLVEAHGGRIWAENCTSGGARFSLLVPSKVN
jgi:signal transduction histidine kinase